MKIYVGMSSGQDSAAVLYKLLTETDHEIYARNSRYKKLYPKNEIDFFESYTKKTVEWLKTNVRDFDFDINDAYVPEWSFYLPEEKRKYTDVSKEVIEKYYNKFIPTQGIINNAGVSDSSGNRLPYIALVIERFYNLAKHAKEMGADSLMTGHDSAQMRGNGGGGKAFVEEAYNVSVDFPLGHMHRFEIFESMPEELRKVMNPCDYWWKDKEKGHCGKCRKCLTRKIYYSHKYSMEELGKLYTDQVLNKLQDSKLGILATGRGTAWYTLEYLKRL